MADGYSIAKQGGMYLLRLPRSNRVIEFFTAKELRMFLKEVDSLPIRCYNV